MPSSFSSRFKNIATTKVHRLLVLWIQLVLTSYAIAVIGSPIVALSLLISMLGIFPLSVAISRLVNRDLVLSVLVGGVVIGVLEGGFAYLITEWAAMIGILYGVFYGASMTFHFSQKSPEAYLVFALITTVLLLIALMMSICSGDLIGCIQMYRHDVGRGLLAAVCAALVGLVLSPTVRHLIQLVETIIERIANI